MGNYQKLRNFERRSFLKYLGAGGLGALAGFSLNKAYAQVTTQITNQKITCEEIDCQIFTHKTISDTELGYLNGVSSNLQTQLNAKASTSHKDTHKSGGSDEITSSDLLEAVIKRLRESSGPTDLTLGSIADGEYLKRSGSTIIGGTPAGSGGFNIEDWKLYSLDGPGYKAGDAGGGGGEYTFSGYTETGGTSGDGYERRWNMAEDSHEPQGWFDKSIAFPTIIKLNSVSNVDCWIAIGVQDATEDPQADDKCIGLHISDNDIYSMSGDGSTLSDSGSPVKSSISAETTYYLIIYYNVGTGLIIYENGSQIGSTKSTNNPSGNPNSNSGIMKYRIKTGENAQKKVSHSFKPIIWRAS